nr:hypothetical protein [Tanacetum cinerariifolium]
SIGRKTILEFEEVHNFVGVIPDIENMMLEEYLKYEPKKEGQLWKSIRSKGSPTKNDEVDIDRLEDVLDDLFKIGADNIRRMKQDEVQVKECDEGKLEEI